MTDEHTTPATIFLQPDCCVDWGGEGRQWCEDDVWGDECPNHSSSIAYVRSDLARADLRQFPAVVEAIEELDEDTADECTFYCDDAGDGLVLTQHRYYRMGNILIAVGELNYPNNWRDDFDERCEYIAAALSAAQAEGSTQGDGA